jgi:hypothetical protein
VSVVTNAVRPATRWMRVVSRASARVMGGSMVVSRRASLDVPAPGWAEHGRLWLKRLHPISLYPKGSCCVLETITFWWYAQIWIPTVSGHCCRTSGVYAKRVQLERFQDAFRFGQCQAEVLNLLVPLSRIATSCTRTSRPSYVLATSCTLHFMGSPPVRMLRIGGPIVPPCQSSAPAF